MHSHVDSALIPAIHSQFQFIQLISLMKFHSLPLMNEIELIETELRLKWNEIKRELLNYYYNSNYIPFG